MAINPTPFTSYSLGKTVGGADDIEDKWTNRGYSSVGPNLTPGVVAVNTKIYPLGTIFKDADTEEVFVAVDRHGNKNPNVIDFYMPPDFYQGQTGQRNLEVVGKADKLPKTVNDVRSLLSQYGKVPQGESAQEFLEGKKKALMSSQISSPQKDLNSSPMKAILQRFLKAINPFSRLR